MASTQTQGRPKKAKGTSKQQKTGKDKSDAKVPDAYWATLLKRASDSLAVDSGVLKEDLDQERKTLNDPKDFKPFVVYVDEAFKHLYAAINYKPGHDPSDPFQFQLHPAELIEAIAIFAEGLSKKDFKFIDQIFGKLQQRCDKLFGVDAAKDDEERKKRLKAYTSLFICLLKAWVIVDKVCRAYHDPADDPDPAQGEPAKEAVKDVREKVEKGEAIKAVIDWFAELAEAIATLVWTKGDRKSLLALADEMKTERKALDQSKKDLDAAWKGIGLPNKVRKPDGSAVTPQPGVKEAKISECVERLKAIGEVIKQCINLYEAWEAMAPKEIGGTWRVTNFPDAHVRWSLEIEQTSKNRFEGKLKGHGAAHPDNETLRARASEWFDEEKASVEISRKGPDDTKLTFKWKPSQKKEHLFPAAADGFYYGAGEIEDEFEKDSIVHLVAKNAAIGQKSGATAPVALERSVKDLTHVFKVAVAILQLVGALWAVIPEKLRNKILAKVLQLAKPIIEPPLQRIQKCVPSVLTQVKISIDSEGENENKKYLIGLELSGWQKKFKLIGAWDILKLLNAAVATATGKKAGEGETSALMPRRITISVKVKQACDVALSIAPWDGKKKDPTAGKNLDLIDKLLGGVDMPEWWPLRKSKGVTVDVDMPRVRAGKRSGIDELEDVLPAVELPIYFYIDDLLELGSASGEVGGQMPARLTLTVSLTAAQVARAIPQVRAVLVAWDIGWSIGSFINELPPVQRFMDKRTQELADWVHYGEIDVRSDGLVRAASNLVTRGAIPGVEMFVLGAKCMLFAADEWCAKHSFQAWFREGRHPLFDAWKARKPIMETDARKFLDAGVPPAPNHRSPGHTMAMAFLLGSGIWTRDEVVAQLDKDVRSGLLHPMQRDLADFYLIPFDEEHFESAYKDKADQFLGKYQSDIDQARQALSDAVNKNEAVPAKAFLINAWGELVAGPDHKDFVACLIFQAPDPAYKDQLSVTKGPTGYLWEVFRARGNERLTIEFLGVDRYLGREPLRFDGRRHAVLADCRFHYISGEMSKFAGELASQRQQQYVAGTWRWGATFTLKVSGGEQSAASQQSWFMEMDGENILAAHAL